MKLVREKYLPLGYPEQPDNGTWEDDGGAVPPRQRTMWAFGEFLIADRETFAEILLEVPCGK